MVLDSNYEKNQMLPGNICKITVYGLYDKVSFEIFIIDQNTVEYNDHYYKLVDSNFNQDELNQILGIKQ